MTTKTLWGVRTNFSIGESILTADRLFKKAKELGYTHVAIADTMSVSALIDAANESRKEDMQLISGCTLRVAHWSNPECVFQPKVYCKTEDSFKALMQTLSAAQTVDRQLQISWDQFVAMLTVADYTVTTGDIDSAFSSAFPQSDIRELVSRVRTAQKRAVSQGEMVCELIASDMPYYQRVNDAARLCTELSDQPYILNGMPLYETPDEAEARDVMHAIARNMRLTSGARQILQHTDFSMKTIEQLEGLALITTDAGEPALADSLAWRWSKMPVSLPQMSSDEFRTLMGMCKARWPERIGKPVMGYQPDAAILPEYVARLKHELTVLKSLGFCNYFLLVEDLVSWAKRSGIIVGPGRGSVGGSLVAFLLGITDVDPIRFDLLFERFINPERLDLPDADLDFMSERRHEVVGYLRGKYGDECVANISNYNTLGPASAIGEVAKAFDIPDREVAFKSFLPKEHGQAVPLERCEDLVPDLKNYASKHPHEYQISRQLEGQLRSMGTHAAGVVVASVPIADRAVALDRAGVRTICWDKRVVEDQGLVKMDILGLTNLDVIGRACAKIKRDEGKIINMLDVPLDDKRVLDAFGRGETVGVFQYEGGGMRKLLKDLRKGGDLTFADLCASTALFRPGPIDAGLMDDYVSIRQGAASEHYDHPNMEAALKSTFGVIIYQEQVMQLARDLAGFTMAQADGLRKAMGKKDRDKMAAVRDKWVAGCQKHSAIDADWSNALFDKIEMFAGYGFNKSHSVEYSVISVWTMWLKIYHPHAFYAAILEVFKEDKLQSIVLDAAKHGIEVLPPDINLSTSEFTRLGDHLLAPLNRIKGVGEPTEKAILEARAKVPGGAFRTVDDLINNVEKRKCNIRHRKLLEDVGAFASIIPGSLPARHPDRVKTQLELLPGLIAQSVRADRTIMIDTHVKSELSRLYMELRDEGAITLPRFGKKPKMVVVFEAPSFHDEKAGKLMETDNAQFVKDALKAAGLSMTDIYATTFLKRPKSEKTPTNEEIQFARPFFEREMELLKPPVILALGSFVTRELCPDERGGIQDMNGKVVFDKKRDASVVIAISPGMIWHDPTKQALLNDALARAAELFT